MVALVGSSFASADPGSPGVLIGSQPSSFTTDHAAEVGFSALLPNTVGFSCRFDAEAAAPCNSGWSNPAVAEGAHSLTVQATDSDGQLVGDPVTVSWTVDTTKPVITLDASPSDPDENDSGTIRWHTDDPDATITCDLNGWSHASDCQGGKFDYSSLTLGIDLENMFTLTARDVAGNETTVWVHWGYSGHSDPCANSPNNCNYQPPPAVGLPTAAITEPMDGIALGESFDLDWTIDDPAEIDHVDVLIQGQVVATLPGAQTTYQVDTTTLPNGMTTFQVRVVDADGTVFASQQITLQVDNSATEIASPSISGPDALVGTTWTIRPGAWSNYDFLGYQWYRCVAMFDCAQIDGATGLQYRLTADDLGLQVKAMETAYSSFTGTATGQT